MERIGNFVYNKARLIIVIVAILNIVALASFFRFELDTDFLSFFAGGNPKAEELDHLNEKYQSGETISVLVEQDESLLAKENLGDVFRLQEEIEAVEGISQVQSFLPPEIPVQGDILSVDEEFIDGNYELLKDFIENKYFLTDQFLSPDGRKGMVVASLTLGAPAGDVVKSLKEVVENEDRLDLSLAGNEIVKDTLWHYLVRIFFVLPPCAIFLILLVFAAILRSRRLTPLAMIPAGIAVLWTFGTLFWSGQKLNLVTVISPLFILTIGSAYGLHYISHFLDNLNKYSHPRQLTVETMRMVGTPILLATLTTMAGFASLT